MSMEKIRREAYKQYEKAFQETFNTVAAKYIRRLEKKAGHALDIKPYKVAHMFSKKDKLTVEKARQKLEYAKRAVDHYLNLI